MDDKEGDDITRNSSGKATYSPDGPRTSSSADLQGRESSFNPTVRNLEEETQNISPQRRFLGKTPPKMDVYGAVL